MRPNPPAEMVLFNCEIDELVYICDRIKSTGGVKTMYALFETTGWIGKDYALRAGTCEHIVGKLDYYQCLSCLARQGRSMGTDEDQKELDKINEFLCSYHYTREEMEEFSFDISTGSFRCLMCAETKEEAQKMKDFIMSLDKDDDQKRK